MARKRNKVLVLLVPKDATDGKKQKIRHYYVGWRNSKKNNPKLSFKKYDPSIRKHVDFVEKKMPSPTP